MPTKAELEAKIKELTTAQTVYDTIIDTTTALIIVLDAQANAVLFNRACQDTTGYSLEEIKQQPFWDLLILPEEREQVRQLFQDLQADTLPPRCERY